MEQVLNKFYSGGKIMGVGSSSYGGWGTGNIGRSASVPKYHFSIPQNLLPLAQIPSNNNGISFYANSQTLPPLNKYGMSPEMMKMNMLEAKIKNLEMTNNEDLKNRIQMSAYLGSANTLLPYIQANQSHINANTKDKEDRRYEIKSQIHDAKNKLRNSSNHTRKLSMYDHQDNNSNDFDCDYDNDNDFDDSIEYQRPSKKITNKQNVVMRYGQSNPTFDEEDVEMNQVGNVLKEENDKVRMNLDLMKDMLQDMHSFINGRFEEIDNKHQRGMAEIRRVLENTGSRKIKASLRKIMDGDNIDLNQIEDDIYPQMNNLASLMDDKIKNHDENQKILKETKRKEKEEKERRDKLEQENEKKKKEEEEKKQMEENISKKKALIITNPEIENITMNDPSRKSATRKKKSGTLSSIDDAVDKEKQGISKKKIGARNESAKKKNGTTDPNAVEKKKKKIKPNVSDQSPPIEFPADEAQEQSPTKKKRTKTKGNAEELKGAERQDLEPGEQLKAKGKGTNKMKKAGAESEAPKAKGVNKKKKVGATVEGENQLEGEGECQAEREADNQLKAKGKSINKKKKTGAEEDSIQEKKQKELQENPKGKTKKSKQTAEEAEKIGNSNDEDPLSGSKTKGKKKKIKALPPNEEQDPKEEPKGISKSKPKTKKIKGK